MTCDRSESALHVIHSIEFKSSNRELLEVSIFCTGRSLVLYFDSLEGRGSMATQRTHREFAPRYAAGKVPVPWGRECHWETRRPWLRSRHRSTLTMSNLPRQEPRTAVSPVPRRHIKTLTLELALDAMKTTVKMLQRALSSGSCRLPVRTAGDPEAEVMRR